MSSSSDSKSNEGASAVAGAVMTIAVLALIGLAVDCSTTHDANKVCYPMRSIALIEHGNYYGAVCASPAGPVLKKRE